MRKFGRYTATELDEAQERYGLRFAPALIEFLGRCEIPNGYAWNTEDRKLRDMLNWPYDLLFFDIEHGSWWPDWGPRPATMRACAHRLRDFLNSIPRLIPLMGHRFAPELFDEGVCPVFSMHGFDTICYGATLDEWLHNERAGTHEMSPARQVPFWSDIVQDHGRIMQLAPLTR